MYYLYTHQSETKTRNVMKTAQAILKCNKKAWPEIKMIKDANNMVGMDQLIGDAIEKTFGLYDRGVLMIRMRRLGQMGALEGEKMIRIRRKNFDNHVGTIRHYLIDMIPTRFHNSMMYAKLIGRL